jgi:hypothetical protein
MRKFIFFLMGCIFMVLAIGLVLNGWSGDSSSGGSIGTGGGDTSCGGGLFCKEVLLCCPVNHPYYCDGQCLTSPGLGCNKAETCTAG